MKLKLKILFSAVVIFLASNTAKSQTTFPDFLTGTWKIKGQKTFEQWNVAGENHLKGFSYQVVKKQNIKSEDLELIARKDSIVYLATVLNQNDGKPIAFKLNQIDSLTFSFENPNHDFPQKIIYKRIKPDRIAVSLIGNNKAYGFTMKRVN